MASRLQEQTREVAVEVAFPFLRKALLIWLAILALAITNGILRESLLSEVFEPAVARTLSGLLLSALILGVSWLSLPWLGTRTSARAFLVGAVWLALTLIFEFAFGIWQGKSWQVLLQAYTFQGGNIWPVVLLVTALAPWVALRLRHPPH